MIRFLSTSIFLALSLLTFAQGIENAGIALMIYDLDCDTVVTERNADVKMTPASVMKLFTTATALQLFGPDSRIHTVVTTDGTIDSLGTLRGNIYIRGALDPTIESAAIRNDGFFKPLIDSLKHYGIRKIEGDIVADGSIVEGNEVSPKWAFEDISTYYGAGCYGFSLYDNVQRFTIKADEIGQKCTFVVDYPETEPNIISKIKVVNGNSANLFIYEMPYSRDVLVEGKIGCGMRKTEPLALTNPVEFAARHLKTLLQKQGIEVSGSAHEGEAFGTSVLFVHLSPKLKDIIEETNHRSNNHYAEHLFRLLGSEGWRSLISDSAAVDTLFLSCDLEPAATANSVDEIRKYWSSKGVDLSALTMYDGNGLSPMDAASARMVVSLLSYMWNSDNAACFFNSLPVCGSEGTVKRLFNSSRFIVNAKSGSMSGVQCFAGYLNSEGRTYAFCVMFNEFDCSRSQLRSIIEQDITNSIEQYETAL